MESPHGCPIRRADRSAHPAGRALCQRDLPYWHRRRNAPSKISPRFERQTFCFKGRIVGSDEIGMILAPLALLLAANKLTQVGIADLGNVDVELPGRLQNVAAQAQVCRALAR